jgi:apolipoprotein D and lipocalin family protein
VKKPIALFAILALSSACQSTHVMPMRTVPHVDLPRYMGSWYVVGSIPTSFEKDAYNAIETYELDADGTIDTTFTFRKDGFDGKPKEMHARGFIRDKATNALWGMRLIWPFRADYRIVWLADDYSQVVVAREKLDYLWIMARTPQISAADYQQHVALAEALGYDAARIRKVPQRGDDSTRAN